MITTSDANLLAGNSLEAYVYRQALRFLPQGSRCVFYAAPWGDLAYQDLEPLNVLDREDRYVITVFQAENLFDFEQYFIRLGITDVFWPYVSQTERFLNGTGIRLWPFPLMASDISGSKESFCPYDEQTPILEFIWSVVGKSKIPVFPSSQVIDHMLLPGQRELWRQAMITGVKDNGSQSIEKLSGDEAFVEEKLQAVRQLNLLYGKDFLIYDLLKMFVNPAEFVSTHMESASSSHYGRGFLFLEYLAEDFDRSSKESSSTIVTAFNGQLLQWPIKTANWIRSNVQAKIALRSALKLVTPAKKESFLRACKQYGILQELYDHKV